MQIYFTLSSLIHLIAVFLGLLIAAILWVYPGKRPYPYRKLLSAFFGILALGLSVAFANESGITQRMPHLYRMGNIFGWLFMPFSYLYTRSIIKQRPPGWLDLLHALPAIFYIVDLWPFFMLPAGQKAEIYQQTIGNLNTHLSFSEGRFTPPYFHLIARNIQFALYWLLQVWLLSRLYRIKEQVFFRENREWLRFITTLLTFQFFMIFPTLLMAAFGNHQFFWLASEVSVALAMVFSALVLFFRPQMLYGIHGLVQFPEKEDPAGAEDNSPSYLDEQTVQEIKEKLTGLMEREKPYLNSSYTIGNLSNDLGIPAYKLSTFLNQEIGRNFNDYINQHRILYCLENLNAGNWRHFTVQAIAEECGFNNRNTFSLAFKRYTRTTPTAYLHQLKNV